ncbi:hypothetical protein GH733_006593 [Mirounga leonina]|nr:hypothetical protein GH733_006593 [Mirounga leonina]
MGEDLENKAQSPFVNFSKPLCISHSNTQQARIPNFSEEPLLRTKEALIQRKDIQAQMAELTMQNSSRHIGKIILGQKNSNGDGLQELNKQATSYASDMQQHHL